MRLLQAVPGSVLWLRHPAEPAASNLRREAAARGVDPARLVFARRVDDHGEHLARQRLADLFLDTQPYNAHTTASDALFVGLPVLTCRGSAFAGRVAESLLRAAGLPELVATDLEHYERLALQLANDPRRLHSLREHLGDGRGMRPWFDTHRYTRQLEAGFEAMLARALAGEAPADIDIPTL
jgi:predicted O-linked N-acetylglucosamine transferase (SPINDLY family)